MAASQTRTEDRNSWCMRTSGRLRSVHASFTDDQSDRRQGFVEDELEYALEEGESIPGETRASLLEALELLFPAYGEMHVQPPQSDSSARKTSDSASPLALDDLVAELMDRSSELNPQQLAAINSISAAGKGAASTTELTGQLAELLTVPTDPAEVDDCVKAIQQVWKLLRPDETGEQVLKMSRMVKMLGILAGSFKDLHLFAWSFWKEIAPREVAGLISPGEAAGVEAMVADYVSGGSISSGDFFKEVEKTKKIIIGLLHSSHRAGLDYGSFCERKFSPDAVTDAVALEESATDIERIRDLGRKCWERYCKLSRNRTAEAMHDEFLRIFAENVHSYIRKQS